VISFSADTEIEKVVKTMQKRISKPHVNLLRIYSLEFIEESLLCNPQKTAKVYSEYLQKTLKGELAKRRKNGSYLSEELRTSCLTQC
jgi:CRISPR/Cas system endoribonuclease Cas6 (RAMP superfamily)